MVKVGSARSNEKGGITGGVPGDQTGRECSIQNWYLHNKGWIVIRAVDEITRNHIARCMEDICENNNIGYCQTHRTSLYSAASIVGFNVRGVKIPCETDCSDAVRTCLAFAGIQLQPFTTGSMVNRLALTNKFDILNGSIYTTKPDYLCRGDILVTKTKGHTVVVLSDGLRKTALPQLQLGDRGESVRRLQIKLRDLNFYHDNIDGEFGQKLKQSVIAYQGMENLTKDGIVGKNTHAKLGV